MTENPQTSTDHGHDQPSDGQELQLKLLKTVVILLLLIVAATVGYVVYSRHVGSPVIITVDGKSVATVRNLATATEVVGLAEHDIAPGDYPTDSFVRMQKVQFDRTSGDAPIDSDETARHTLASLLKLKVRAYVIKVNGVVTVGLPSQKAAEDTLTLVKNHYISMPPNDPIINLPHYKDETVVQKLPVSASRIRATPEDAAPALWTSPLGKTYVVKEGDRGYTIAVRHHVPFSDFLAANAGHDMNKLQPGDVVNLQRTTPILTVIVQKRSVSIEAMFPGSDPEESGRRRVTYMVTYTNGVETKRDILSMVTLSRPRPRTTL